jgi:hypothetical protein
VSAGHDQAQAVVVMQGARRGVGLRVDWFCPIVWSIAHPEIIEP